MPRFADTDYSLEMSIDTAHHSRRWRYLLPDAETHSRGERTQPHPLTWNVRINHVIGDHQIVAGPKSLGQ